MIKKKAKVETANALRKAAFAAGAFKPRAGGAAAKLFAKETKPTDEADGISGVFVPQRKDTAETKVEVEKNVEAEKKAEEHDRQPEPEEKPKDAPIVETEAVPSVTISSPLSATPDPVTVTGNEKSATQSPSAEKPATKVSESDTRRKKRRSNQQIMNISKLGIDASILDDRGLEFESLRRTLTPWSTTSSRKLLEWKQVAG
jgi:hypothetical protein